VTIYNPHEHTPSSVARRERYRLPSTRLAYDVSRWTRSLFEDEVNAGGALEGLVETTRQKRPVDGDTVEALHGEVFGRLYGFGAEQLEEPEEHARSWASKLHEEASDLPEWRELAARANGDTWASALATSRVGEKLVEKLPPLPEDPEPLQSELEGIDSLARAKKWKKLPKRLAGRKKELEKRIERVTQLAQDASEYMEGNSEQIRIAVREAAAAASKEIGETLSQLEGLGCGRGASNVQRQRVLRMLQNPTIAKIAKLAGRMRRAATTAQRSKSATGVSEVVAVELGDNLARLLPVERALLGMGGIGGALLYSKLVDRRAQQYEVRGTQKDCAGPILFAFDESGSMGAHHGDYTRNEWAKAFALAMMQVAIEQRRPFGTIHYAYGVEHEALFDTPWTLKPEELLEVLAHFAGGGTQTASALVRARQIIEKGEWKPGARADVVLLTDGIDYDNGLGHAAEALRSVAGAHLYTVAIDTSWVPDSLKANSESVVTVDGNAIANGDAPPELLAI
jgi:uncharacterized protein with von Willebrand factor type A (vWA) domain